MKIRDGYWGVKEGIRLLNPVEIRDTAHDEKSLTLFSATRKIHHRGATLNCPLLTTEISSPFEDVIHVKTSHFKGSRKVGPEFVLEANESSSVEITDTENLSSLKSGALEAKIVGKDPVMEAITFSGWELTFSRNGKKLTQVSGRHSGHVTLDAKVNGHYEASQKETFMCEYLNLSVGETIYGLGERFTPFVKNGQSVDIWNEDGGTASEIAYKNIPFYLSSRGYGILVNNPGRVQFEVASEVVTAVQFSVPGEVIDYYIISGDTLKQVLQNYTRLSGKPALPPAWSFGLWLTTSFTTNYDEKTVTSFIEGMAERDIPLHVFHFDCFWMRENRWVDFIWDPELFPDPENMLSRLKKRGLNICVWINPYVAQHSVMFDEGAEHGYLVKTKTGDIWQWNRWQAGMGLVDFTNPEAVAWYQGKLKGLIDMGVDTFKTDFGERIPTEVVYHDGSDPEKMHNFYTYLYNEAVFSLLERQLGKGNALVFARSATVGGQKFPVHWGGDCSGTYESMAESLRGGLSLALSGFGFWSHDMGGFELTATPDVYKRWIAFGSFSSHSRLHGNESYRVPWNFDEESSGVLRFFTRLKCSLMPYIFAQAIKTHESGIPMMRPMILEHQDDPTCAYLDRQYYFGESMIAAPIFNEEGTAEYYLPAGIWTNFLTNEAVEGGSWQRERHTYMSLPLMIPENTVIPVGKENTVPVYDYADALTFHLFSFTNDSLAECEIYTAAGEKALRFTAEKCGDSITVSRTAAGTPKPWSILLRNADRITGSTAGTIEITEQGVTIAFSAELNEAVIKY